MKILHYIYLLLVVALLAACHDDDILQKSDSNLPDPDVYISFTTRAPGIDDDSWMLLPMPGQNTHTVEREGHEYDVVQHIGVFGYFTDDDASNVTEIETPVFDNEILEEYDEHEKYPDEGDGNIAPDTIEQHKNKFYEEQEKEFYRAAGEKRPDGTAIYYNGAEEDANGKETKAPDKLDNPDKEIVIVPLPFGTRINEDGSVEMADGTKISEDGTLYRTIVYREQTADGTQEETVGNEKTVEVQIKSNGEIVNRDGLPADFVKVNESGNWYLLPDSTTIDVREGQTADTPIVIISFTMKTADGASVHVDYSCSDRMLNFNLGENSQNIDLGSIWDGMNQNSGDQTNPVKPRFATRADAIYDDYDDKYYYGYNHQRWMSENYMFYGYAPASRNAKIDIDPATGEIGGFTWEKIPCVSTSDLVVAKEEVWRKNKDKATADVSRIHFDDMQHLMARIRLYFAVHRDFHKTRRVVVTQASLSFMEEGFRKVYTFKNERNDGTSKEHGKETWTWTEDKRYVYNPKYNTAFYSAYKDARPKDMVVYENRTGARGYGKLLAPLPTNGDWHPENLFTDFFIVPYKDNKTEEMTLHVKYTIYDTDPDTSINPGAMQYYTKDHVIRECQRESTITFKTPMQFKSGVSHALKIMINPDYIYVLGDHDEPADVILK